jgi:hypothetical protein
MLSFAGSVSDDLGEENMPDQSEEKVEARGLEPLTPALQSRSGLSAGVSRCR